MIIDYQFIVQENYIAFCLCLVIGTVFGYLGTHVLKRGVVFIDISLAQFAAIGAILAEHVFCDHGHGHGHGHNRDDGALAYVCSISAVILIATFYSVIRRYKKNISLEAIIGVTYAIGFATAVFIISICGSQELHAESFAGDLNAIFSFKSIMPCLIAFGVVGLCACFIHKPLARISEDYEQKADRSLTSVIWDIVFYTIMGVTISFAIVHIGVVMVFVYLVVPAVIANLFTHRLCLQMPIMIISVAIASVVGLATPYVAYDNWELELSTGPHVGLFLGLILIVTAVTKSIFSFAQRGRS